MSNSVVVIGSSNMDVSVRMNEIPKVGQTVLGDNLSFNAGGKGANQAVAVKRSGGDVAFVTKIGDDLFGSDLLRGFAENGLDITNVITDLSKPSGVALIFIDSHGQNSIAVAPGANSKLLPEDISDKRELIAASGILLMQLEIPIETVELSAKIAVENNVRVILNPAPAKGLGDDLLKNISIITPNETEAEILTGIAINGETDAKKASEILSMKGVRSVVITLGEKGCYVFSDEYKGIVPSYKMKSVDSTAAGDVFNGALATALSEGHPLREAARFANAAAALSVTRFGAQASAPYREDIREMLKRDSGVKL